MKKYLLSLLITMTSLVAQSPRVLTLDEAVRIALDRSIQVQQLEQNLLQSQMNLAAAKASYRSNSEIVFSSLPNLQRTEQKIDNPAGGYIFSQQDNTTFQGQLYLNQPIPQLDGTFSLVSSLQRFEQRFTNDLSSTTEEITYSPNLTLQYQQRLFTYNRLKTGVKRAELNLEETEASYSRNQLDLLYNITTRFFSLFREQQQVEINRNQVEQSEEAYNIGRLKQQAGLLPEVEVLRLEIDLANAQNTLATTEATLEQASDNFKHLVGLPIEEPVRVTASLEYTPITVTEDEAIEKALEFRTEFRTDEIALQLGDLNIRETDAQREVQGQLSLRYGLISREDELSNAFRDFNDDRSLVLSMTVPLWDWGQNSYQVQASQAGQQSRLLSAQDRYNAIKIEIRAAVRNLHSANQRVQISRRSQELAEQNYRISLLKFENGDLSSQELTLEQNRLTQARTNYLGAVIDYRQALADIRRKTLWDFETNQRVEIRLPDEQ